MSWLELGYSEKTAGVVKIVIGIEIIVMIVAKEQNTPASISPLAVTNNFLLAFRHHPFSFLVGKVVGIEFYDYPLDR